MAGKTQKKPKEDNLKVVTVRLNKNEHIKLSLMAASKGQSKTDWLREQVRKGELTSETIRKHLENGSDK